VDVDFRSRRASERAGYDTVRSNVRGIRDIPVAKTPADHRNGVVRQPSEPRGEVMWIAVRGGRDNGEAILDEVVTLRVEVSIEHVGLLHTIVEREVADAVPERWP
jgi:hypothetical protein